MNEKITLNAMHVKDLNELLLKGEVNLTCANCSVKVIDANGIGGLVQKNGKLQAICRKEECANYTWQNAMQGPDE